MNLETPVRKKGSRQEKNILLANTMSLSSGKYNRLVLVFLNYIGGWAKLTDIGRFISISEGIKEESGRVTAWRVLKALEKDGLVRIYSAKKPGISPLICLTSEGQKHVTQFFNELLPLVERTIEKAGLLYSMNGLSEGLGSIGVFYGGGRRRGFGGFKPGWIVGLAKFGVWKVVVQYRLYIVSPDLPGVVVREASVNGGIHEHIILRLRGKWSKWLVKQYVEAKIFEKLLELYEYYPVEAVNKIIEYYLEHGVYIHVERVNKKKAKHLALYLVKGVSVNSRYEDRAFNVGMLWIRRIRWVRVRVSRSWLRAGMKDYKRYILSLSRIDRDRWEFKRLEMYVLGRLAEAGVSMETRDGVLSEINCAPLSNESISVSV